MQGSGDYVFCHVMRKFDQIYGFHEDFFENEKLLLLHHANIRIIGASWGFWGIASVKYEATILIFMSKFVHQDFTL